jgi:hypothetical protein
VVVCLFVQQYEEVLALEGAILRQVRAVEGRLSRRQAVLGSEGVRSAHETKIIVNRGARAQKIASRHQK